MYARVFHVVLLVAAGLSLGTSYSAHAARPASAGGTVQSKNFIVTASTAEFAQQVCAAAERYRRDLAIEWLGAEIPDWQGPCPIRVTVGPQLGAGGATSFAFVNGRPIDWQMTIQGSRERVLDSVLPHEITHTILATHFGRPLPRWADEGAATSVEHISERSKQQKLLIEFLTTERGIPFNEMFAMKEYPRDILPLYSQGYSLARFLIAQHDKQAFVRYVGDGMRRNNWTEATRQHYGVESLSALQIAWLDWVKQGSPTSVAPTQLASHAQPHRAAVNADTAASSRGGERSAPGWYARQRDLATAGAEAGTTSPDGPPSAVEPPRQLAYPQTPQRPRQMALPPAVHAGGGHSDAGTVWR